MKIYTACRSLVLVAGLGLLSGCATAPTATYVDPSGNGGLTTVGQINFQDFNSAGVKLVSSLIASGRLDRADGSPAIIMLGRIDNRTSQQLDTALLTQNIRIALSQSGKAAFSTAVGANGAEDTASQEVRTLRANDEFAQSTIAAKGTLSAPEYSLAGRIIQQNTYAGNQKQAAYTFQLVLSNLKHGVAVWEAQEQIVKKGTRPSFGL